MTIDPRDATLALLATRSPGATICPSEVARAIASESDWRDVMPAVHIAIDSLVDDRSVQLSWKGKVLAVRNGPYRIRRIL